MGQDAETPQEKVQEERAPPAPEPARNLLATLADLRAKLGGRKIIQWGLAYVVVAFGLLQALDIIGDTLDWPRAANRSVLAILGMGFVVALILAWFHGDKGHQTISKAEAGMLGACGVACLALLTVIWLPGAPATQAIATNASAVPRLAVMRLDNLGDTEAYFAEGVADELISELSQIKGIEVVARTSSFVLTGERATPANASKELGATLVLTGSVRRLEGRVRVQAQLVSAPAGTQVWTETFERPADQIYSLQRDIALRVATTAQVKLQAPPARRVDPEAFRLYLEARQGELSLGAITTLQSDQQDLFRRAVERDPNFAEAWSALGRNEFVQIYGRSTGNQIPTAKDLMGSVAASDRALAIDPALPEAWVNKSDIAAFLGQWPDTAKFADEALKYRGYHPYRAFSYTGRLYELLEILQQARRLDPFSIRAIDQLKATCLLINDTSCRSDAARRLFEIYPDEPAFLMEYFEALAASGEKAAARELIKTQAKTWAETLAWTDKTIVQYYWSLLGDAQPPSLADLKALAARNPEQFMFAYEMLARTGRGDDLAELLPIAPPSIRFDLEFIYNVRVPELRRRPEFWAYVDDVGLTPFWRDSGKWPDFCQTEPVCEAHLGKRKT